MMMVVAVALMRGDGAVLLQQRPLDKQHGGLWEFPGGKVEAGEAAADAAVRELAEELGIGVAPAALVPVGFAENRARGLVILLYLCRAWEGAVQCLEGEALCWEAPERIAGLDMPPLDYPLAQALLDHLRARG